MVSLFIVLDLALDLYMWALIIVAVLSWLTAFGVVNSHNRFVYSVTDFLNRITEPALRQIRRVVPPISGLDLSPIILIFLIIFLRSLLREYGPL